MHHHVFNITNLKGHIIQGKVLQCITYDIYLILIIFTASSTPIITSYNTLIYVYELRKSAYPEKVRRDDERQTKINHAKNCLRLN